MCMVDSVAIACQVAPCSNIIALVNHENIEVLSGQLEKRNHIQPQNLTWVSIESLRDQSLSIQFSSSAKADKEFRDGFWLQTANRFMLIADLMVSLDLKNCLHLENDNVLYFDPSAKLQAFQKHARFAIPFDRSRAIPGIVWYGDAQIARELARYIQDRSDAHDFDVIRQFCDSGLFDSKPLPTMSTKYVIAKDLSRKNYCDGYEQFGGIFDAAAIGQYIGGVDPRNIGGDTRFFINETSDLNLGEFNLLWEYQGVQRQLLLERLGEEVRVLSAHMHSKDSLGASPFNRATICDERSIITGERFQDKAELTITSKEVTAFHGRDNIRSNKVLEIPQKKEGKLFRKKFTKTAPEEQWIKELTGAKVIFVYTHLLDYFKKYILRRINLPFILISHNSDDGIDLRHLEILNYPFLEKWYAQNCEINHEKLFALPIGLTNRQWGAEKIAQISKVSGHYIKSKLLYSNYSIHTHPGREILFRKTSHLSFMTISQDLAYEDYLIELAQHKFCLCPRGNGVDTHRFWESQYLNTIPIILKEDWTPSYSGLPILILNCWSELEEINLQNEYVKISTCFHNYSYLDLNSYITRIFSQV